ncbi:hypothetical protein V6N11_079971 [Hibiscus sabdariffa]|uniref:Uncharacterized protein n=1 Tax=Hibiscus sabdariffa TaxID=183260 RepID=A0ABR2RX56_9ROSI
MLLREQTVLAMDPDSPVDVVAAAMETTASGAILQEIKITDVEEGASYTDETVVPNSVSINLLDDSSPKHVIHEEPRGEYLHVMEFSIELGIGISDEQIGMIDRVIEFDKKSVNISEEIGTGQIVKKLQKCFLNLGMSLGTWIDVLKKRE